MCYLTLFLLTLPSFVRADGIMVPWPHGGPVSVKYHKVRVEIRDGVATTYIDQIFKNEGDREAEWLYLFPVPEGAAVSAFSLYVDGEPVSGEVVPADSARKVYEEIVRRRLDPGLLEYVDRNTYRARIFPVPPGGTKRVEFSYDEVLTRRGEVLRYVYPLDTERFSSEPLELVSVEVDITSSSPIKAVYSPSHEVKVERPDENTARVGYADEDVLPDRDFVLYYTVSEDNVGFHFLFHREPPKPGFFLMLVAPRVEVGKLPPRRVLFVLDTSGSMRRDGKIEGAKEALRYVLEHLDPEDLFWIVQYSTTVRTFSEEPLPATPENVKKAVEYVEGLSPGGGTNMYEALLEALSQTADDGRANLLLFLTDGIPTVGVTDPDSVVRGVTGANGAGARLFVFGVGYDVNAPLLDLLASGNHGTSLYVHPGEDIAEKVATFYEIVSKPVLSDVEVDFGTDVEDLYPRRLPDLFGGTQLVQVGRYLSPGETEVVVSGRMGSELRKFSEEVTFPEEVSNPFIPRIWAVRKVGYLLDQIRLHGEEEELVEEIIALSKRYGIITPYTSFLVTGDEPPPGAFSQLGEKVGAAAVRAAEHLRDYSKASTEGKASAEGVRYVWGKAFFLRDGSWVDAEVGGEEAEEVRFGSDEYFSLLSEHPGIGRFLSLGKNLVLKYDGAVYRIYEGTDIPEADPEPGGFGLLPNFPNPFNSSTLISFVIPEDSEVSLKVYDVRGRMVRKLEEGPMQAGEHGCLWDGRDQEGSSCPSGVYIYLLKVRVRGKELRDVGKMVLMK